MIGPVTRIVAWTIAAAVAIAGISCGSAEREHAKKRFFRMDTFVDITLVARRNENLGKTWRSIDSILGDWEELFSQTHARSEVRRLNEHRSQSVRVSPMLAEMLATSVAYGDSLDGGFDVTILPVKEAWGFGEKNTDFSIPTPEALSRALERVGYTRVRIDTDACMVSFTDSAVMIDVGGVAKGFALREMDRFLRHAGRTDYLIVAGGDILCRGRRHDATAWRIGIQHPRQGDRLLAAIALDSGAIVTSGDYERFRIHGGVRYHHLFDPVTGHSCRRNQSLTVWARDPIEADILSTGLFCRPANSVLAYVNERSRLECVVVDSSGACMVSDGWEEKVSLLEK